MNYTEWLTSFFLTDTMRLVAQGILIAALVAGALLYIFKKKSFAHIGMRTLAVIVIVFRLVYAIGQSIGQYYVWSQSDLTRIFLESKLSPSFFQPFLGKFYYLFDNPHGYFFYYIFTHFFLNTLIAIAAAFLFYAFLRLLKRYQERFFQEGEVELGFLAALVVGWPNFVLFLPLVFMAVIVVAIVRMVIWRLHYTTLGYPFLLAAVVVLLYGDMLITRLGLDVLRI